MGGFAAPGVKGPEMAWPPCTAGATEREAGCATRAARGEVRAAIAIVG